MLKPNIESNYAFADLYPNWGGVDTSNLAQPEPDDQEALNENVSVAEEATTSQAKSKNIFLALLVLVALVIFFGGN